MSSETAMRNSGSHRGISGRTHGWQQNHPVSSMAARRTAVGLVTLFVVSILVFLATEVLPGNAAYAVLGHTATPRSVRALEVRLHLDRPLAEQYYVWISSLITGHLGNSLANGQSVWGQVAPRLVNSAVLVVAAGLFGTILGVAVGAMAALRRDGWFDHVTSALSLGVTALPEFVVAIVLVTLFATVVWAVLPAVDLLQPGSYAWSQPKGLVLPIVTLVIVIVPYILRMTRGSMIEALESDYVEMARLKGVKQWRVVIVHALPNAIAPTIQVIGLALIYLAGGVVIVENVFNYPGIGQGLVNAVADRDIPVIQVTVLMLAAFYVFVNIVTDVIALLASPRRRIGR